MDKEMMAICLAQLLFGTNNINIEIEKNYDGNQSNQWWANIMVPEDMDFDDSVKKMEFLDKFKIKTGVNLSFNLDYPSVKL